MEDVTLILSKLETGEASGDDLLAAVYEQLRRLAQSKMSTERQGHTLQATALVHEAWLRLGGDSQHQWKNRKHFFAAAAEAMRRILIDRARRVSAQKRGGDQVKVPLEEEFVLVESGDPEELLALDQALDRLQQRDPRMAQVVKLRFFTGLSIDETAEALGDASERTVSRLWTAARAWLHRELSKNAAD